MIYEFKGVCRHCATEVSVLIHNGSIKGECPECANEPFEIKAVAGVVYVISNPNQMGVKIGMTNKSVEDRIRSLSSSGVPGSFDVIAIFPSDKPKKLESRIHEKLAKFKISKEHFDLTPIEAVLKIYRILNKSVSPIFYDLEMQTTFKLRLEHAKTEMELKLRGQKLK